MKIEYCTKKKKKKRTYDNLNIMRLVDPTFYKETQ